MPAFTIELPNGKRLDVEADDENAALTGAQDWYKQNTASKTDTSMTGALTQGASDLVSGVGKTIKEYVSKDAGSAVMDKAAKVANPNYKSGYESFSRPEDGVDNHFMGLDWKHAPRAIVEQAPALASDLLVNRMLKRFGPVAQFVGTGVNFGARSAGNEAQKRADARSGVDGTEPTLDDKVTGLGSTVSQAALNSLATSKVANPGNAAKGLVPAVGNVAKAAAIEGATNAGQDLISQGVAKAGTDEKIDLKDTLAQGVLGTAGGGTFAAPHAIKAGAQSFHTRGTDHGDASTYAANRLVDHAGGVEALDDPSTAYKAMKAATQNAGDEFGRAASTITAPSTETANAVSRVKAGEALSARELDAIDAEGNQNLSSLARELTALRTMRDRGSWNDQAERWAGGAGEMARNNSGKAMTALSGLGALPHIAAKGGAGLDTLMGAIPGMAEAAAGGYAGFKAIQKIEKMAGVQSPGRAFADRFADASGQVRPDPLPSIRSAAGVSVPSVDPKNSLTTPQPWGPVEAKPTPFKPDMLEPGIRKLVEKIENQKRRDTAQEAMPLLRRLAEASKPPAPPEPDTTLVDAIKAGKQVVKDRQWADSMREQHEAEQAKMAPQAEAPVSLEDTIKQSAKLIKGLAGIDALRNKTLGSNQAEREAANSPLIEAQGGLDAVRNPAMGKRANELIAGATALARLRRQPEEAPDAPPTQPQAPQPDAPAPQPEAFTLPESKYWHLEPREAAAEILNDAINGGKEVRHPEGFKAGTQRRLAGEEAIYSKISASMPTVAEKGALHKYLSALWGSDSPEVVTQVRAHMLMEFPQHAETINKHLSDAAIKGLWTKPKKKK